MNISNLIIYLYYRNRQQFCYFLDYLLKVLIVFTSIIDNYFYRLEKNLNRAFEKNINMNIEAFFYNWFFFFKIIHH